MSNSAGNTNRDVRKWLRKMGVRANARNVDLIGREVRRSAQENERVERAAREIARIQGRSGTEDGRGRDVHELVRRDVARRMRRGRR